MLTVVIDVPQDLLNFFKDLMIVLSSLAVLIQVRVAKRF
jgi:hypothetical protein